MDPCQAMQRIIATIVGSNDQASHDLRKKIFFDHVVPDEIKPHAHTQLQLITDVQPFLNGDDTLRECAKRVKDMISEQRRIKTESQRHSGDN